MGSERLIPEVLFRPSDIGINQAGLAEAIVQVFNIFLHHLNYGRQYKNVARTCTRYYIAMLFCLVVIVTCRDSKNACNLFFVPSFVDLD
jgi:hypothetical protein